jgi:hypothetical protein
MFDKSIQTELEDLWKKLNPYPEGSYKWYGWSLEVDCENYQFDNTDSELVR